MNPTTAYLGLGANLGDPIQQLINARAALYELEGTVTGRCSSFYLSSPVGYSAQPDFINCVVELTTHCSALELLAAAQAIETRFGRQRVMDNQNAPRLIDIDILLFGEQVIESDCLNVPHPRMNERLFVLQPLAEFNVKTDALDAYRAGSSDLQFADQTVHRLSIA